MDAFDELQTAVVALTERMTSYVSWAEQLHAEFRALQGRIQELEDTYGSKKVVADDDNIEERLAAIRA